MAKMNFGPYSFQSSRENKVFFPDQGITKGDVIDYYARIAEYMIPHLKDRPLTLHRFPDGIDKDGFIQQQAEDYFPKWLTTVTVPKEGGKIAMKSRRELQAENRRLKAELRAIKAAMNRLGIDLDSDSKERQIVLNHINDSLRQQKMMVMTFNTFTRIGNVYTLTADVLSLDGTPAGAVRGTVTVTRGDGHTTRKFDLKYSYD